MEKPTAEELEAIAHKDILKAEDVVALGWASSVKALAHQRRSGIMPGALAIAFSSKRQVWDRRELQAWAAQQREEQRRQSGIPIFEESDE